MKRNLLVFTVVLLIASCNPKGSGQDTDNSQNWTDTTSRDTASPSDTNWNDPGRFDSTGKDTIDNINK